MPKRDENGRLPLPNEDKVPFQRVLSRVSHRSKSNSRRQSPDHSQYGSHHISRSQSFNYSEVKDAKDEASGGYYYDHDPDNSQGGRGRRRNQRRDNDLSSDMRSLSLKKNRSRSLTDNNEDAVKMPYIPFQRVLHIRKKTVIPENKDFRVERYRNPDRQKRFTNHDWLERQPHTRFATEYNSRYKDGSFSTEGKRRGRKNRNDSHQLDKLLINPDLDKRTNDYNDDDHLGNYNSVASEHGSSYSRRNSKTSGGSLEYESSGGTPSSSSSVKLPQIRDSPLTEATPDSATSILGKGAVPSSLGISGLSLNQRISLQPKIQVQETSRWVEGKRSGCLNYFFPLCSSQTPKSGLINKLPMPTLSSAISLLPSSSISSSPHIQQSLPSNQTPPNQQTSKSFSMPAQDSSILDQDSVNDLQTTLAKISSEMQDISLTDHNSFNLIPPPLQDFPHHGTLGQTQNPVDAIQDPVIDAYSSSPPCQGDSPLKLIPPVNGYNSPPPRKAFPDMGLHPPSAFSNSPFSSRSSSPFHDPYQLVHVKDEACWAIQKGAGCLQGFQESSNSSKKENSRRASLSSLTQSQKNSTKTRKKKSKKSKKTENENNASKLKKTLHRSKSDSTLYLPHVNNHQQEMLKLQSNQILIFREKAQTKNVMKGSRPSTPLPSIILTYPDRNPIYRKIRQRRSDDDDKPKPNLRGKKVIAKVPSLPNIHTHYQESNTYSSNIQKSKSRPQTPATPRRRMSNVSQNSYKSKPNTKVISTLRKSSTVKRHSKKSNTNNRQRFTKSSKASRRLEDTTSFEPLEGDQFTLPFTTQVAEGSDAGNTYYIESLQKARQERQNVFSAHFLVSSTERANTPRPHGRVEYDLTSDKRIKIPAFSRSNSVQI